ncbi:ANKL1 protein, partial [Cepphus grylle]|nr:ANKL1 protein [Cepphus grylle]
PDPGGARRSLSFLTEDGTDGSVIPELPEDGDGVGPLSSTRRSLLEGLELGGGCGSGEPPSLSIPSLTPWPPGGSSLPPQPLASSTLLSAGDELGEGPRSQTAAGGTEGPPWAVPKPRRDSSPSSSPTVLLVPGDRGDPHDTPSDAQGSPGSSPTVLLVPGDCGGPHDTPSDAQGSSGSSPTVLLPQRPAVPLSPAGSTRCSQEHLEDEERGQAPSGRHSPGTAATTSREDAAVQGWTPRPLSDEGLRRRLRALGDNPGPVTELTSPELVAALRTGHVPDCAQDELALARQFDRPDRSRHWREGLLKSSFNYLLLDPRTTQNLPLRSHRLSPAECFGTFVKSIFYVGKGTRARPYCHLAEALSQHRAGTQKVGWAEGAGGRGDGHGGLHGAAGDRGDGHGGLGAMVAGIGTVTNQRKGNCYGVAASWPAARRRRLGVHMLHRAMRIFLAEGERQLRPPDIQGGR